MKILEDMVERVSDALTWLESGSAVKEQLEPKSTVILDMQSAQLMEGKRPDGHDIRPYYTEDRYFDTPAQANWYKAWKQEITPNSKRNPDAPNLYINGKFHSELDVYFEPDGIEINGSTGYALGIVRKYGLDSFGLSPDRWNVLMQEALPQIVRKLREKLL
jgi:hypothetical protein